MAENGYHNSQVSKIAKEAGVADGTIYLYFQNKEDILISLFRMKMGEFTALARRETSPLDDPFKKLAKLIIMHFSRLQDDRNLASVIQIELRQSDQTIRQEISVIVKDYYNLIEELLAQGKAAGTFRDDLDVKVGRKLVFGCLDEIATCWVLSSKKLSLLEQVKPTYNLLSQALAKGGKYPAYESLGNLKPTV